MSLFDEHVASEGSTERRYVRRARYEDEPGFYEPGGLWLYGNVRLLHGSLGYVGEVAGKRHFTSGELDRIQASTELVVLGGHILVCGIHNEGYMRSALVPLRWGSPRIVVFAGGFYHHLGPDLKCEPFQAARLWRYAWDPGTDLAVSLEAPDQKPRNRFCNPTVDKLITAIAWGSHQGLRRPTDPLGPPLNRVP